MTAQVIHDEIVDAAVHEISNLQIELSMLKLKYEALENSYNELVKVLFNYEELK